MKRYSSTVIILVLCIVAVAWNIAQAEEEQTVEGTIAEITAESVTLAPAGAGKGLWGGDKGKKATFAITSITNFENVDSSEKIVTGDKVSIVYCVTETGKEALRITSAVAKISPKEPEIVSENESEDEATSKEKTDDE